MLYQAVPKRTIQRLEDRKQNPELESMIIMLELCRESDEALWKQLLFFQLDDLKLLKGREGRAIKTEMRRKLQHE